MGKKRIVDLPVRTSPSGGYVPIDGDTGTGKYNLGGITGMIATEYDPGHTYPAGDYCVYEGNLYRAKSKTTPGEFVPSKWTNVVAADELRAHKNLINGHTSDINGLHDDIAETNERIDDLELQLSKTKKYGVSGVGLETTSLTRIWDSVGMTAQAGTDSSHGVVNNFDKALPFARRKCVGRWVLANNKPAFHVTAYYGDDNYTEDGSLGDYVAVECPLSYYYYDAEAGVLGVSATKQDDSWKPFDIFTIGHDPDNVIPYYYAPAYSLALDEGNQAVSLPGKENCQGCYKELLDAARTYGGGSGVGAMAHLEPFAWHFYNWMLFVVEYATTDCQSVMAGYTNVVGAQAECISSEQFLLKGAADTSKYPGAGDRITILGRSTPTMRGMHLATHVITLATRVNEQLEPSAVGNCMLIDVEDLGRDYVTYEAGTTYMYGCRPCLTGACGDVLTPSGSPGSNVDGRHQMRYRWVEGLWGNQSRVTTDLFVGFEILNSVLHHTMYSLKAPESYKPANNFEPFLNDLKGSKFDSAGDVVGSTTTLGYITALSLSSLGHDIYYPTSFDGSDSTYYCDEVEWGSSSPNTSYLVAVGGRESDGGGAGLLAFDALDSVGGSFSYYGSGLFFPQGLA